ncbi:VOC family protein [Effusibacillus lacus]|uniref:Glyoxalase-like domain-containing protein n=1 Tax=Effusibacillus lacus TaxID=1348429 RepID=A0A292YIM0_9BACL|nr:VOC family protein [Effusibacillus lacus]TCS74772.1 glyoxalase-like protein [Effusibacillus lacus]GAX88583.1 hypothetical protein EFBL_0195 [Effusibacillus lacus]
MNLKFDHLVHFINCHPLEAVRTMQGYGFHAVEGGRHESWGTYNSLCYFGLSYIEFLGIENRTFAEKASVDYKLIGQLLKDLPNREGFGQIALRTDNINQAAFSLQELGLTVSGPFKGNRKRQDDTVIEWQLLFLDTDFAGPELPFLIQWNQSDQERESDLITRKMIAAHPVGDLRMSHIAYAVHDLDQTVSHWKKWFGLESGNTYFDQNLNAMCHALHLQGCDLLFCSSLGTGIVSKMLQTKGEKPFLVAFDNNQDKQTYKVLGSFYRF